MTDEDRRLLDMAGQRWNHAGNHADAVRTEFGMSVTRFWQKVSRLLDDPDALEYSPQTVYRLRRLRASRRESR